MPVPAGICSACVAIVLCLSSDVASARRMEGMAFPADTEDAGIGRRPAPRNASGSDAGTARAALRAWLRQAGSASRPSPSGLLESGEGKVNEPSPKALILNFELLDYSQQGYAQQMLMEGCEDLTDPQRVYMSLYPEGLLHDAINGAEHVKNCDKTKHGGESKYKQQALAILHHIPELEEAVLYSPTKWEKEELNKLDQALNLMKKEEEQDVQEDEHCKELLLVLEKVESGFYREMHTFKRKHFYLGMTDSMVAKYGKPDPKGIINVQLSQVRGMHTLDTEESRAKSDRRRDASFNFFKMLFESNLAGHSSWDLNKALKLYGTEEARGALESQTPMMAFRVEDGEVPGVPGPVYVLSEGNGRLGGLLAALDQVRALYPNFCEPRLAVQATNFAGPSMARKNWLWFLRMNWRNQFPGHVMEGWTPAVPDSVRPLSREEIDVIESRPRYFGYRPA